MNVLQRALGMQTLENKVIGHLEKFTAGLPEAWQPPLYKHVVTIATEIETLAAMPEHDRYDVMLDNDPELFGCLDALATMFAMSYMGVQLNDRKEPRDNDGDSIDAISDILEWDLDIDTVLYDIGYSLAKDGNYVAEILPDENRGITLKQLPMTHVTAIPEKWIEGPEKTISWNEAGWGVKFLTEREVTHYVVNEGESTLQRIIPKEDIFHIKALPANEKVDDKMGRKTYGVWGKSVLKRVLRQYVSKMSSLMTDMEWRRKAIPREHHKMDSSGYMPDYLDIAGNDEKIKEVEAKMITKMDTYAEGVSKTQRDAGDYITTEGIDIQTVEPKAATYQSPNLMMEQIVLSYCAAFGVPASALNGAKAGDYGSELITSSYAGLKAGLKSARAGRMLMKLIRDRYSMDKKRRYFLKMMLIMPREIAEFAKVLNMLKETGDFTSTEIRSIIGKAALTEQQKEMIEDDMERRSKAMFSTLGKPTVPGAAETTANTERKTVTDQDRAQDDESVSAKP